MALAARIMCSSCSRFILFENCKPDGLREDAAKGAGLPQAPRFFVILRDKVQYLFQRGIVQNISPFKQCKRHFRFSLSNPTGECNPGTVEQFRSGSNHLRNGSFQGETTLINPFMRFRMSDGMWRLKFHGSFLRSNQRTFPLSGIFNDQIMLRVSFSIARDHKTHFCCNLSLFVLFRRRLWPTA